MVVPTLFAMPPWMSASFTDLYASASSVYFPTTAIFTRSVGRSTFSTSSFHFRRSGSGVSSRSRWHTSRSSPWS